jgi:putative drug exporter of the RND superfamily
LETHGPGKTSRLHAILAFLIIISIGEAIALTLEYQNNSFLRDYVSQNTTVVVSGFLGVGVLGLGLAYLVYRRSSMITGAKGAKGPGIFHRLGDLVTKHNRVVILAWILIVLASLPLALNVNQAVTSQNTADTSNTESAKAQQIISDEFPHQQANSSALVVIVGADVTDNGTKQFALSLESKFTAPDALSSLQNYTSVYSLARTILVSTITPLSELVTEVNASSFIVYGVPSIYLQNWVQANATNSATADAVANSTTWSYLTSPSLSQQLGPNAPLVLRYYQKFYQYWISYSSTPSAVQRTSQSINSTVPVFITSPPALPASLAGIITATSTSLSLQTWNQQTAVFQLFQTILSSSSQTPTLPLSLLQSIFALGPNASTSAIVGLANQIINSQTLSSLPLLPPDLVATFVSSNKNTMLIDVTFSKAPGTFSSAASDPLLQDVLNMRKMVTDTLATDPGPQRVYITGSLATTADSSIESNQDISRIDPITVGAILVLVGIFFVAIITPLVPLGAIGMAVLIAQGLVYLISRFVVPIQDTTLTFLFTVMLGVGTDYAIFLIARYREERIEGMNRNEAVHTSVKWVGESITTSGMTVILSFGVMSLSSFAFLKSMGIGIGTGVLIALLVSLTMIPAILTLAGDKVFWPNSGKRFERHAAKTREKRAARPSYFRRAASFSASRPKTILLLALIFTIPAAYVVFTYQTTYDFVAGLPNTESVQGLNVLQQGFGAGIIGPTQVVAQFPNPILQGKGLTSASANSLELLSAAVSNSSSNVARVTGPTRPEGVPLNVTDLSRLNPTDAAAVRNSIGRDNRTAVITVILSEEPFTVNSLNTVQQIRNTVSALQASDTTLGNAQILVGGESASTADFAAQTNSQFNTMRIVVVAGIFIILLLVLGSYILPIAAILSIGLSIIWSAAATIIFFKTVLNSDIIFIIPLILFLLLFGIGMDYNIFILTRIREEAQKGKPTREAVVDAVDRTGGIITALALILGGAIGSLMLSSNRLLEGFGFAISLAVVLDAMVVRTYLVPATMSLLGRWAWWGPRRLRRVNVDTAEEKADKGPSAPVT